MKRRREVDMPGPVTVNLETYSVFNEKARVYLLRTIVSTRAPLHLDFPGMNVAIPASL